MLGAALGSVAAAGVAWLWSRFGHRVNLALFFQATAIFLFVFVVQLVIKGAHEMSEQNYLPYSTIIHDSTEAWGPDSMFGCTCVDQPARDPAAVVDRDQIADLEEPDLSAAVTLRARGARLRRTIRRNRGLRGFI